MLILRLIFFFIEKYRILFDNLPFSVIVIFSLIFVMYVRSVIKHMQILKFQVPIEERGYLKNQWENKTKNQFPTINTYSNSSTEILDRQIERKVRD